MKQVHRCSHVRRRQAVLKATDLNGIDWIEVDSAQQDRLRIGFLKPLPGETDGVPAAPVLTADHFEITGGSRIPEVQVDLVVSTSGSEIILQLEGAGDFSTYSLRLRDPAEPGATPDGFDPILSRIYFSFKVTCPTPYDCKPDDRCPNEPTEPFHINRLARDFDSIRQALVDRWQSVDPEFSDPPLADTRAVMLDLLAATGDVLSHYQDAVTTESTLQTARLRPSFRRHARLLDYPVGEGCNARTFVHIEIESGSGADGTILPSASMLYTGNEPTPQPDQLTRDALIREGAQVFETRHPITLRSAHNSFSFHTYDEARCCLPAGSIEAVLVDPGGTSLANGDYLVFEEIRDPLTGSEADADPAHRHVVRLVSVTPATDPVENRDLLHIRWDPADALPFALSLLAESSDPVSPGDRPEAARALGNIAPADHGRSFFDLPLVGASRPRLRDGRYSLPGYNLTFAEPFDPSAPASSFLHPDAARARPCIEIADTNETWLPRTDLLGSLHDQPHFVVEMNEDRTAAVRFGDGSFGKRPDNPASMRVHLRIGSGPDGNVGIDTIRHIDSAPEGVLEIRNPVPAVGAASPETLERIRHFAPEAFYTQERAVTLDDARAMAMRHPEVQDAHAELRWTGSHHTLFLAVDRYRGLPVDPAFKEQFVFHMERYRMAGIDLEVREPERLPLEIELTLCIASHVQRAHVLSSLERVFTSGVQMDGTPGLFHPDRFTFGTPLYLSALIEAAMRVPGVHRVIPVIFKPLYQLAASELEDGVIQPAAHQVLQLSNDPNFRERGILTLNLSGGI